MADETTSAAPAADAAPAVDAAIATTAPEAAPAASTESAAPSGATEATTQADASSPSLISTADTAKAKEIDGAVPDKAADAAKPDTAGTEAAKDEPQATKPADGKSDAEKPAADAAPAEKAPAQEQQARSYEAFKLPEGMTLAEKETKEFTDVLDDGKLSHQERAQKLVDLYVREAQRFTKEFQTQQTKAWNDFTEGLKADFKADPVLGGNRQDTTLGIAKAVIERFGGNDEQKSDLYAMLDHTGMGNHKGLVRVLNNIFETYMREPRAVPGTPPVLRNAQGRQNAFYGD